MLTRGQQQHLLLTRRLFQLIAGPVPQVPALRQPRRWTRGRDGEELLEAGLGQGQLQRRVLHHHLQENRLRHQPELTRLGGRQSLARHPPQEPDVACGVPRRQPAQRERNVLLIERQQAHLPLGQQGHTRRQGVVVVQLLPRPQLQRLQGLSNARLRALRQLGEGLPATDQPQGKGQLHSVAEYSKKTIRTWGYT